MGLTQKQLAICRSGITATDMCVLASETGEFFGRTVHDVFASKVLGVDDFHETEATELGSALEPFVVPRLAKKIGLTPLRIDPEKLTVRHPKHKHHIATPDALFAETAFHVPIAAGQIKVCGIHAAGAWGSPDDGADGVPEHVLVQCAWEIHCTVLPVDYVGALIGTEIRNYQIDLTPDLAELIEGLCELADRFHTDHVLPKVRPPVDGSEGSRRLLSSLWPRNRGTMLRASPGAEDLAKSYFDAKRRKQAAEQEMETASQKIVEAIADSDGIVGDGWRALLKLRDEATVNYVRKAYRHFDLRAVRSSRKRRAESGHGDAA